MTAISTGSSLRLVGGIAIAAGSLFATAGIGAWCAVSKQLRDERITVPENAPALAGRTVQGPASAYVQALVIKRNSERAAGGRTFADISEALHGVEAGSDEANELRKQSAALQAAAALRASLMTSVLAYGVSALVAGLGLFFAVVGSQFRRAGKR